MNKPAVILLIGFSCFFTFVASGSNPKVKDQRLPEYMRLYFRIDTENEVATWQLQSPSGTNSSNLSLGKLPGNDFYSLIVVDDEGVITEKHTDFNFGLGDMKRRFDAKLAMLSETWEVFQVDVSDINATLNPYKTVQEEMIHFRKKSQ